MERNDSCEDTLDEEIDFVVMDENLEVPSDFVYNPEEQQTLLQKSINYLGSFQSFSFVLEKLPERESLISQLYVLLEKFPDRQTLINELSFIPSILAQYKDGADIFRNDIVENTTEVVEIKAIEPEKNTKEKLLDILKSVSRNEQEFQILKEYVQNRESKIFKKISMEPFYEISATELISDNKKIGKGAFASVYHAKWRNTDVAVKDFPYSSKSKNTSVYAMELATMARVRHPNIIQFLGYVNSVHGVAIVMEYASNGDLSEILKNEDVKIEWPLRCKISLDIAHGFTYLHLSQIIHRDIKSANIFVSAGWVAKLGDFGFSTSAEEAEKTMGAGTGFWLAPELLGRGGSCTEKTDIFSVGVVFNEIASRKRPHCSDITIKTLHALTEKLAVRNERDEITPETPKTYAKLITHCWDAMPEKRPTGSEIISQLKMFEKELQEKEIAEKKMPKN